MKHHDLKQPGGKGLFHSQLHTYNSSSSKEVWGQELKQNRNLEVGAGAEAMEEYYLLAWFLWLAQSAFL